MRRPNLKLHKRPATASIILQKKALELICSEKGGILQSELGKRLGIDSSRCSKLVSHMIRQGLIRRVTITASRTYLLEPAYPWQTLHPKTSHINTYLKGRHKVYLTNASRGLLRLSRAAIGWLYNGRTPRNHAPGQLRNGRAGRHNRHSDSFRHP